ncbi:MAG: hypothetical protein II253_04480 [Lachnospiraceae bacterium]|nr:hypothetical protein [Lachnospiraceae bacterium]
MKKHWKTLIVSGFIALTMTTTALAGVWKQNTIGWWWENEDGSYPVNCWQWIDGNQDGIAESYCFDSNGYLYINTQTPDGYLVDINGAWIVNGVVQTQKKEAASVQEQADAEDYSGPEWQTRTHTNYSNQELDKKLGELGLSAGGYIHIKDNVFFKATVFYNNDNGKMIPIDQLSRYKERDYKSKCYIGVTNESGSNYKFLMETPQFSKEYPYYVSNFDVANGKLWGEYVGNSIPASYIYFMYDLKTGNWQEITQAERWAYALNN